MHAHDLKWHSEVRQIRGDNPGEGWIGNEGFGLVHRSPQPRQDERRLLLTLDWLA